MSLAFSASAADAQGVAAKATTGSVDLAADVKRLRVQVDALERRIQEMEKDRIEALKDMRAETEAKAADDAKAARLEQRVASLEKANREEKAAPRSAEPAESPRDGQSLTVVAPFVVKDRAGKTIMVVQDAGADASGGVGSRGLYIYSGLPGAVAAAHVGVADETDGGRVYTAHPGGSRPDIVMGYFSGGPQFFMNAPAGGKIATIDKTGFSLYSGGKSPVAELTSKDGRGLFFLNSAAGAHMVEAGSLISGKGYVLANPYKPSTALTGDPSVLKGGGKP